MQQHALTEQLTQLLSERDVSLETGIPAGTLRYWRARGLGPPYIRLGTRSPRYVRADVQAWLERRRVGG